MVSYLENKGINSSYIKGESDLSTKKEVLKIIDEFNEKLNNLWYQNKKDAVIR